MIVPPSELLGPAHHYHWEPFMTYWTVSGVVIYAILLAGTFLAKTPEGAWWFAMPAPLVCIFGIIPATVYLTHHSIATQVTPEVDLLTFVLPLGVVGSVLGIVPSMIRNRKITQVDRAREQRMREADERE